MSTAACVCVSTPPVTRYQEETRKAVESINAIFTHLGSAAGELLTDTNKLVMVVVGGSALALGVYGAREGTRVAGKALDAWLGTPKLVSGVGGEGAGKPVGSTGYMHAFLGVPGFVRHVRRLLLQFLAGLHVGVAVAPGAAPVSARPHS